ncbi:MAG: hypothetical protein SGI92_15730 [Bryobacteraceae bacterium]|nr:hypothetical protein [Bryobacteraceae bacterium]
MPARIISEAWPAKNNSASPKQATTTPKPSSSATKLRADIAVVEQLQPDNNDLPVLRKAAG